MTLREWSDLPEDVPGEIVDGRLVDDEVPDYAHEVIVAWLARLLGNWADLHDAIVGGSDARLAVTPERGRKADLTVYFAGRRPPARGLVELPPDIAVEVVSAGPGDARRDHEEKRQEYAVFGIGYYWLVDPRARTFEILRLGAAGTYEPLVWASAGTVAVEGCQGLALDLDAMWAKVDALAGSLR
jgi:Uma2 family endonuclease